MEVSLRPTATAAATLETALLDLDQSAVRNEVAAEVAVPGASTGTSPTRTAPMEVSLGSGARRYVVCINSNPVRQPAAGV